MSELRNHPRKLTPNSATFTRTGQPPTVSSIEDCEGCPALAGVRNLGLDDPSAGCSDSHRNFGVRSIWARRAAAARRAGSLKRGCTGRTVRRAEWQALASAWHVVAIMRRRGRVHGGVSSFGCGGPGWSSSSNADATSRQPPAEEPHSSQRSNNARIRASPRGALRAGSRTSGRKSARTARPVCARRYKITSARKSLTLVCVGPVTSRSPIASK